MGIENVRMIMTEALSTIGNTKKSRALSAYFKLPETEWKRGIIARNDLQGARSKNIYF